MRKFKLFLIVSILIVICFLGIWIIRSNFLATSDNLSLSYSPSACGYWRENYFYVHNNILYFIKHRANSKNSIMYVKNNVIHTFAKIPIYYERFIIVDENNAIIQWQDTLHLLKKSDDKVTELWKGECVGCYEGKIYFTKDNTLYSSKIDQAEPNIIISYDELLAFNYNGITYRVGKNVYQLLLEKSNEPKLLMTGNLPWPEPDHCGQVCSYLYTPYYALHINGDGLDMYVYKTGELKQIYKVDGNMVATAVVAKENEMYISRQCIDGSNFPLINKDINGTFKYDIQKNTWTKISNKTYATLVQFDENYLYGHDHPFRFFTGVTRIKID